LHRPLFCEGEAGVGKTELAKALAAVLGAPLIRLQCYEGIDASQALYDWDFPRQLLHLRTAEVTRQAIPVADPAVRSGPVGAVSEPGARDEALVRERAQATEPAR